LLNVDVLVTDVDADCDTLNDDDGDSDADSDRESVCVCDLVPLLEIVDERLSEELSEVVDVRVRESVEEADEDEDTVVVEDTDVLPELVGDKDEEIESVAELLALVDSDSDTDADADAEILKLMLMVADAVGDTEEPKVIARPDLTARQQIADRDLVALQFPAYKESKGTGEEPIRVLAMSKHEASNLIEKLKQAVDAIDSGRRYDG